MIYAGHKVNGNQFFHSKKFICSKLPNESSIESKKEGKKICSFHTRYASKIYAGAVRWAIDLIQSNFALFIFCGRSN